MKKKLFMLCLVTSVIMGCTKDNLNETSDHITPTKQSESVHTIPVDVALASLTEFLNEEKNQTTKSGKEYEPRRIGTISEIRPDRLITKSVDNSDLECDKLVYLVNFEEQRGYALLAADDRIQSRVISVIDKGNLSEDELYDSFKDQEKNLYPEYPLTGSGLLKDPEGTDELFINPNTFSLYDKAADDSFVGNFIEDTDISDREPIQVQRMMNNLTLEYTMRDIRNYTDKLDDFHPDTPVIAPIYVTTVTSNDIANVSPILTFASFWRQENGFNEFSPVVRKYLVLGKKKKAPSGCVPLSIAKILATFEFPQITYNGMTVNWQSLNKRDISILTRFIGSCCNSLYFYEGTFTFPSTAKSFLKDMFYQNVKYTDYNTASVIKALDNGCPVFICSIPGAKLKNSHGWNIDGYKKMEIIRTKKQYVNGINTQTQETKSIQYMVHCDFGWGGFCNGYFVSGIFNLGSDDVSFDHSGDKGKSDTNYNNYLKIITYDNPTK